MTRAVGWLCLGLVLVVVAGHFVVAPRDPMQQDLSRSFESPGREHPLGTDGLGRDVWARVASGAGSSLLIALVAVALSSLIGIVVGGLSGIVPRAVDRTATAMTDTVLAFPRFVLLINLAAIVPFRTVWTLGLVIGLTSWMRTARLVRTEALSIRSSGFIEAARAAGAGSPGILFRHVLPQVATLIWETARLRVASVILTAASLDFLGIGLPVDRPTWGRLIADGQSRLADAPWIALPAIVALCLTAVGLVFVGERRTEDVAGFEPEVGAGESSR